MREVYLLHHVRQFADGHEDVKLIGVYSSRERALAAQGQVQEQPGFRDHLDGFTIAEQIVDCTSWKEGFGVPWSDDGDVV